MPQINGSSEMKPVSDIPGAQPLLKRQVHAGFNQIQADTTYNTLPLPPSALPHTLHFLLQSFLLPNKA
jgi:hypothetical protein